MSSSEIIFDASGVGQVRAILDAMPTIITDGYGGWKVYDRMRRKGLTQWDGVNPVRMQIPILFDGFSDGESQEIAINRLNRMAVPPEDWGEPPPLSILCDAIPRPGPELWIIESTPQWGTQKVIWGKTRGGNLARLRQEAVVNVMELVDDDRVAFSSLPPAAGLITGGSGSGWPRQYITRAGDTLLTIAAAFYKDSTKWNRIGAANGIRDPKAIIPGMLLKIPKPNP